MKILLLGGAGLVGQNLITKLQYKGYTDIVVLDKHVRNLNILTKIHQGITAIYADLAEYGQWERYFENADAAVMLQAQIGGNDYDEFIRNNVKSTEIILNIIKKKNIKKLVHISSSVVESTANDFYTNTKKMQEQLVLESGIDCPILRPTLMFGWFDRKHLGWLARFMEKSPIFPIPGDGRYMRQPLYVGDFANIIISCLESDKYSGIFNISGHEKIDYIDIIREIKQQTNAKSFICKIPYPIFSTLLYVWGVFDKNPPFTTQQLKALVAKDEFDVIDWPKIFNVPCTPFKKALRETLNTPHYSQVVLEF